MPKDLDLPKGCDGCHSAPFVVNSSGGVERCNCARGRRLYELDQERKPRDLRPARRRAWRRPGTRTARRAAAMPEGRSKRQRAGAFRGGRFVTLAAFHLRR